MEIEQFAEHIVLDAQTKGASDIHILPELNQYVLFFRISGELLQMLLLTQEEGNRLISYFKYLGNMDVGERRKPQSGSVQIKINKKKQALRFSTITNFRGQESLVIRLLIQNNMGTLKQTAFFQQEVEEMTDLVRFKSGLLLFSGPVGSGKTTTMYQLIRDCHSENKQQVITVEDPIEIEEPAFLQTQINEKAGISYESLLRSSLRHHPDTLIVGEIRDEETAKMVMRGALTGHLMIASIHAKNAVGVLSRLLELGVSMEQLKQTLLGVIFQKLIPKSCPFCEGDCQINCTHLDIYEKRAVIYEVLAKKQLQHCLSADFSFEESSENTSRSFNCLLRKAYAYGFITKKNFQKYQIP
ncbi:competence type IV pilus ATPase ComGA [Carnobacterium mobile]|uniref:competence type IV pilus ATPase ComGA n=1 Tax=Carnobacterium mobile TaxID=2750 RepID=UPI001866EA23|nr:competence type IV pilus ATPase ComGA [Carnobacterium mobile]